MSVPTKIGTEAMKLCRNLLWLAAMAMSHAAPAAETVIYYHNDIAGSPVVATDAGGNVLWRESYRPYGERLTNAPASADNKVWFTSRRQDVETGLVYMGARYYDPVVGRFISKDPMEFDERNLHTHNRYAYANNNPFRYMDPDGEQAVPFLMPPPASGTSIATGPLGKPSEGRQLRALEGFGTPSINVRVPSIEAADALNFMLGGFAGVIGTRLSGLIFSEESKSLGANPFKGKSAQEIADMLASRGFVAKGPDPEGGKGTFVNPETGRGYHIDASHSEPKGAHVGVHRSRDKRDVLPTRDYPM